MEIYNMSIFCTGEIYEKELEIRCDSRLSTGGNWPITFFIGTEKYGDPAICLHLASLNQLLKFQESFNAAVQKAEEGLAKKAAERDAKEIADKVVVLMGAQPA